MKQVMHDFGVSREIAVLPFCFYCLGLAFGPPMASPISETFGRKIVYISALPVFAAFTIGAGFSQNITALVFCRFFSGLFASPGLSIGNGTIADLWPAEKRGAPMAAFVTSVQIGTALGPVIGGFVTEKRNWRWTQWVILFCLALVTCITIPMSETYKKCILKKRAKQLAIEGPPVPERTRMETIKFFATKTIVRPMHMLFTEPIITLFDVYIAVNFGLLNGFFGAFSWVFETMYGFNLGNVGLTYLGQAVGSIIGFFVIIYVYEYVWAKEARLAKEQNRKVPPETRLLIAKIGAPFIPIS
jgi:multidrug resistance protein